VSRERARVSVGAPTTTTQSTRASAKDPGPQVSHAEPILQLQRTAGNRAVSGLISSGHAPSTTGALALQRGIGDLFKKKPKPPKQTWEKTKAKHMTSEEGTTEMGRVKDQVQGWLDLRDKLISKGMSPEVAAKTAFSQAPPDIQRYLPLFSEFDVVKREIDQTRNTEGGEKQSRISEALTKRSEELGFKPGVGDPMELSPKDIVDELEKDVAFKRQMQRRAERLISGEVEAANAELETAKESNNEEGIRKAEQKLTDLKGPGALQRKLFEMAMDAKIAIDESYQKKLEEVKATLGVDRVSDAEKWRLREEAKKSVRKNMENKFDSHLRDAGTAVGVVGTVGSIGTKAGTLIGNKADKNTLNTGQKSLFKGIMGSIGGGLKAVGGIFSKAVKIARLVNDRDNDKLDKDANVKIALQSVGLVKQAVTAARNTLKVITKFNETLSHDPGFANAIPGVAIAAGIAGYVGNVIAVDPPTERLANTAAAEKDASEAGNQPLALALTRTTVENKIQISTEVVGATANGIRIGASIAEIATAGGMGIPAAIRSGASALTIANKVANFVALDVYRSKTQDARKEGALQVEGSGKKLIKTDIGYSVDTVILAAKRALERLAGGEKLTEPEKGVLNVLAAYGIPLGEAQRLSMAEIHERMLDKLGQDDEQQTARMKLANGVQSVGDALASLGGGEKDETYQDLDTYARQQESNAQAEANQTTGDKIKGGFEKFGGYVKKAVTAPLKLAKLGQMASEKTEKLRRLREIKNLVNYKERGDRGRGFLVSQFGADLTPSIEKLRRFIVATQPKDKASLYLKELNTLSEQTKVTKKVGEKNAQKERMDESITDRVITPALYEAGKTMTFEEVRERLAQGGLGKADREYLKMLLAEKSPLRAS